MAMMWREAGHQEVGPFSESDLKICDLCGALNLERNAVCFVCSWHGRFERRPEAVRMAMELMERRDGRLELDNLTDVHAQGAAPLGSLRLRIGQVWGRMRNWLFG